MRGTLLSEDIVQPLAIAKLGITDKGLLSLCYRSGEVSIVQAHEVRENDLFEYELGLEPKLKHIPAKEDRGELIYFYATFKTKSGGYGFHVMSVEEVREHAKQYSQSYNSAYSPWTKNFVEMARKTVLKQCLKYAPIKTEFARAVNTDDTIKSTISSDMTEVENEMDYIDVDAEEVTDTQVEQVEVVENAE